MLLASTTAKIEFVLGENHVTNQIPGYAAWFDSQTSPTASSAGANSNDTSQVTLVASPGASVIRQINEATICNTDTITHTVKVRFNDGTNQFIMAEFTLPVGASAIYSKQFGWAVVSGPAPGQIPGTTTNDNASAGNVGEFISSKILVGGAVTLGSGTPHDITSISLTAGDWDVRGNVAFSPSGTITGIFGWTSSVSATSPSDLGNNGGLTGNQGISTANSCIVSAGVQRFSLATTTTIFLTGNAVFSVSCGGYGFIGARRMR